jgi:hypothetical protein
MAMDPTTGGCPETGFFVGHIDALFPITHHLSCGQSRRVDGRWTGVDCKSTTGATATGRDTVLDSLKTCKPYSGRVVVGAEWLDPP